MKVRCSACPFDVILMDAPVPVMDGPYRLCPLAGVCGVAANTQFDGHRAGRQRVDRAVLQLQQVNCIDTLPNGLYDTGVDPRRLTLEITESMLVVHAEETLLLLRAIKATGVELAIDDFGAGYSSLAYPRRFRLNVLKIDRAFNRDMTKNVDDASIVSGIIS